MSNSFAPSGAPAGMVPLNPTNTPPAKAPVVESSPVASPEASPAQPPQSDRPRNPDGTFAPVNPATPEAVAGTPPNDGTSQSDATSGISPEEQQQREERKRSANERISQITRQKHAALDRAQRAEAENARLSAEVTRLRQQGDPNDPAVQRSIERKIDRYDDNRHEAAAARADASQAMAVEFQTKLGIARASGTMPDLDLKLATFLPIAATIPAPLAEVIASSDKAPELAHHFGTHPDELYRVAALPAHMAAREIGKIEANLAAPIVNRISQAPKPITPLAGSSSPMAFDPEKSSMDEYAARWHAENKARIEQGRRF